MRHSERFAPSPTGPLHIGHAFSAITAWNNAALRNGIFHIRIEDIDQTRARPEWEAQIYEDLAWLGLNWPEPILRQSERLPAYRDALHSLWARGLLYPCTCTRRDIEAALSAPQEGAPMRGPDGLIYPGTCRTVPGVRMPGEAALRLNIAAAVTQVGGTLSYRETGKDPGTRRFDPADLIRSVGDVVLARRDFGTSYHLSVVLDDAHQQITHVTRGEDLTEATPIHVLLQHILDLPTPVYHHHRLIRDAAGKRLAKRDDARAISTYRKDGATPEDIFAMIEITPLART